MRAMYLDHGNSNVACMEADQSSLKRSFIPPILGAKRFYENAYSRSWMNNI